jgi:hypothetical protein
MIRITPSANKTNAVENSAENVVHFRFGGEGDACTTHSESTELTATGG